MKQTLIVESDKEGKKYQKTYSNVNPAASNEALEAFATMASALSTNQYQGAYIVTKREVTEIYPGGGASTITIAGDTVTVTVEAEPVTVTVEAEPATVTVEAEPKTAPSFSLGNWSNSDTVYSAVISYSGDGNLSANIGSISNGTLTVNDADGNFKGVVTASEGTVYAPGLLAFDYTTTTIAGASSTVTVEAEPVTVTVEAEPVTVTVAGGGKTSPILTVGSFSGLQAPVTYNGDSDLNVLGGSLSGTILTACDYKGVIYSDATANFAPAVSKWQTPIEDYLVAYLPFDSSPTQDLCGSTWTAYGFPQIVDGKLSTDLNAYSYIDRQGTFSIGGQDFTIRFNFNMQPDSHKLHILTQFYTKAATNTGNFCIQRSDDGDNRLLVVFFSNNNIIRFPCTMGVEHHIEVDYSHALATFFIYLDGVFINKFTAALSKTTFIGFNILGSSYGESSHGRYNGTVDEFQLFDGIALHTGTKSFVPPTAAEYAALKAKFLS